MTANMPTANPAPTNAYNDNFLDRLFIWLFSRKMADAIKAETPVSGYSGFVDLSKQIMQGRDADEQQAAVARVLQSLVPAPVLWLIRTLFSPTRLVCVLNAWFAAQMFEWLVGPCEVGEAEVQGLDGVVLMQPSAVNIQKCRYLAESQCVGMCVNMCKLPTQTFFTDKFGIPLTMTPNFDDLSCKMVFGQVPPDLSIDEAFTQPCLSECDAGTPSAKACPKLATP
jgi:Beta-carotene isomerase D27-like, C-terminal